MNRSRHLARLAAAIFMTVALVRGLDTVANGKGVDGGGAYGKGPDSRSADGKGSDARRADGRGAAGTGAARRGMTPEDTYRIKVVSALEISPDGSRIVYALESADREKNKYTHSLFLLDPDDREARPITRERDDCWSPRFSPDGRFLAFLCSVEKGRGAGNGEDDGKAQIFVSRSGHRHARKVTRFEEGVEEFAWSSDGKRFVLVKEDPPVRQRPSWVDARGQAGKKADEKDDEPDPIVITRTQIQADGKGFLGERRTHLWVVSASGGEPRKITRGPYDDSGPQWSPDGQWIAFVSNRTPDPDTNDNTDIFAVRPDGSGLRTLAAGPGPESEPRWSHRGDRLAFVGQLRPNDYYQASRLMVVPSQGGESLDLTGSLDQWVSADALLVSSSALAPAQWSSDDATLYVTFDRHGANYLAAVPSAGGPAREVLGGRYLLGQVRLAPEHEQRDEGGRMLAGRRLYFTLTDPEHPPEIMTAGSDGTGVRRLSHIHDELLAGLKVSSPQKIAARSASGPVIESWLYPPVDLDPSRKYPLILYIHGGPQGFDGDYFDSGLENQILPANGYAVLRVNYRGSTSYGESFCRALWGDWHWREHEDLMASVDEAVRVPWVDGERLGIGGWSYGGIMTVWTAGHTDRFKVGVPERFEVDYLSCFGEDQWFAQYLEEFGSPFEKADLYRARSPGTYAPNIKTPLYLISNEKDGNCPLPQAMQFYQRLKLLGVKTELVIYPREPHVMAEPRHLVDRLHRLLGWFGAHLK